MEIDAEKLAKGLVGFGMPDNIARSLVKKVERGARLCLTEQEWDWALSHGFSPDKVAIYGLTDENVEAYLSDFDYYSMHPLNSHFRIWVNDKLTLKYILNANGLPHAEKNRQSDVMPRYYVHIENDGRYSYLMDMPDDVARDEDCLQSLLAHEGILAVKPNRGSGGVGFIRLEAGGDGTVLANGSAFKSDDFDELKSRLNGCVVTEYVRQHRELAEIWDGSECCLRIVMAHLRGRNAFSGGRWVCAASFLRFGTSRSKSTSNLVQGGVGVGFDFDTGEFFDRGIIYENCGAGGGVELSSHPDTGIRFEGRKVPLIEQVRDCVLSVCEYLPSLEWLGFDVMVSDDEAKICEINTLPGLEGAQGICGPYLGNGELRAFFDAKRRPSASNAEFAELVRACTK